MVKKIYLKYRQFCWTFLCLFTMITSLPAQSNHYLEHPIIERNISKNNWEELKTGIDYSEDTGDIEKEKKKKEKEEINFSPPSPFIAGLLKFLLIASAIGIVAFLIYKLMGEVNGPKNSKIKKGAISDIDLEEIEERVMETDLEHYIKEAEATKQFNLAIRLYYLAIIKELSLQGIIEWKKEKTNRIYLSETRKSTYAVDFQETTRIFERVWYGRNKLTAKNYSSMKTKFIQLIQNIKAKNLKTP